MKQFLSLLILILLMGAQVVAADEDMLDFGVIQNNGAGFQDLIESVVGRNISNNLPTVGSGLAGDIVIQDGGFNGLQGDADVLEISFAQEAEVEAALAAKVEDIPLFFPNPFRQNEKTYFQYSLNKNTDIEIEVYDMLANRVLKQFYPKGAPGAKKDRNVVKIEDIDGNKLSVGVYFVFIMSDGKVLSRAKVAVIP